MWGLLIKWYGENIKKEKPYRIIKDNDTWVITGDNLEKLLKIEKRREILK